MRSLGFSWFGAMKTKKRKVVDKETQTFVLVKNKRLCFFMSQLSTLHVQNMLRKMAFISYFSVFSYFNGVVEYLLIYLTF